MTGDNEELYADCSGCTPCEEITDADYPPVVHNACSFHCDAGDIILADTVEENDHLRKALIVALRRIENMRANPTSDVEFELERNQWLTENILAIGRIIVGNCIDNGYTAERLGSDE